MRTWRKRLSNLNTFLTPHIYWGNTYHNLRKLQPAQGSVDAQTAILAAERIGIPSGTTIYFAVDFDCYSYQIEHLLYLILNRFT